MSMSPMSFMCHTHPKIDVISGVYRISSAKGAICPQFGCARVSTGVYCRTRLFEILRFSLIGLGLGAEPDAVHDHTNVVFQSDDVFQICLKVFADRKSLEQHESYHKRVHLMIDNNEIEVIAFV